MSPAATPFCTSLGLCHCRKNFRSRAGIKLFQPISHCVSCKPLETSHLLACVLTNSSMYTHIGGDICSRTRAYASKWFSVCVCVCVCVCVLDMGMRGWVSVNSSLAVF